MSKQIVFGEDARSEILKGVAILDQAVAATMGPKGRNVIIQQPRGNPLVTKDGVSVANEIDLEDPLQDMGAQLVKEAATKTNDAAGDGTTTATVLAHSIMKQGLEHLKSGANPIAIKRGIDKAVIAITVELENMKKDVENREEYAAIAAISAQDEGIGEVIADVIEKAGESGIITVDKGSTFGIETELVHGMHLDSGYVSPYFVTDQSRMESVYESPVVLLTDMRISALSQILPVLEMVAKNGRKELVIICDTIEGEALQALVVNKLKGTFSCLAIAAPGFGDSKKDMLDDLAVTLGARVISADKGLTLENTTPADLGSCDRVISTKDETTIMGRAGSETEFNDRVSLLEKQIDATGSTFDSTNLMNRLAKLTGGIAVIKVGAATEFEQVERQHRVEDALSATRAAAEEGILPGGGTALIRAASLCKGLKGSGKDEQIGIDILMSALYSPAYNIAKNAGVDGDEIVEGILEGEGTDGYNALTGEYEDLMKSMIIDPKKVTRIALENAASVASMFLTLEVAISVTPEERPQIMMPQMGQQM